MDFLSVLTKGSKQEKILWSFQFYDVNRDGIISRDEMIKVGFLYNKMIMLGWEDNGKV